VRLEDSGQIWLPGTAAGPWARPAEFEARAIRPVHRVRPVEEGYRAACLRDWRCVRPVPYWERLAIDNAITPPVYPVPYWALLRADRLENDAARRSAESAQPVPAPSPHRRDPAPAEERPKRPDSEGTDVGAPEEQRPIYAAPRIGDLPPQAKISLTRRVETAYEVLRFAAAGNLVDLVI